MPDLLPWQRESWDRLTDQAALGRLPHALLIAGPEQSGKTTFATRFAASLLCRSGNEKKRPCDECSQCQLVRAGTHPDFLVVTLEMIRDRESRQIRVEQIRDLIQWANQTAQQGGNKICLIDPADRMNLQASNALLKCLEEPPADTTICLVTAQPSRLLPTLRSRCRKVDCGVPGRVEALGWLETHADVTVAPELLLTMIDDEYLELRATLASHLLPAVEGQSSPLKLAALLSKADPDAVLELLYQLVADSISASQTRQNHVRNSDISEIIRRYADCVPLRTRYAMLDRIIEARRLLAGTSNANVQMLLEWVLLKAA
jgi:DNA polymerase-3 subunit delta'